MSLDDSGKIGAGGVEAPGVGEPEAIRQRPVHRETASRTSASGSFFNRSIMAGVASSGFPRRISAA